MVLLLKLTLKLLALNAQVGSVRVCTKNSREVRYLIASLSRLDTSILTEITTIITVVSLVTLVTLYLYFDF